MRILFISFWSAGEPLTSATILPYLHLMAQGQVVDRMTLATVERDVPAPLPGSEGLDGFDHHQVITRHRWCPPLSQVDLFTRQVGELARLVRRQGISLIDAKGSLAGGLAHLVSWRTGVPYIVESYEPHADYMVDCGVWARWGPYRLLARWLEHKQKQHARYLVTVTENYRDQLVREGVRPDRIKVIPSITDTARFTFDARSRQRLRHEMGWDDHVVGIYVGKFGGIYYDRQAFALFERTRQRFGDRFRLVVATALPEDHVRARLAEAGFPQDRAVVRFVEHAGVHEWLSASDFAYSLHRITPSSPYFSPVKNGEYWANGLPILLPEGVSDDHRIVQEHPWAGAAFDPSRPDLTDGAIDHILRLIGTPGHRERIMGLGVRSRDIRVAREVYAEIFSDPALQVHRGGGPAQARSAASGRPRFR